jgi:cobalt/nickel transport system permease protein
VIARLGEGGIAIYREGLVLCLSILCKGTLAILAIGWLVFTTRFHHLLAALRSFRVPRVIVMTVSFLFRYLDLLSDQSLRVRRARASRSPGGTTRWRWRSTGGMVGRLLLRALDRADRVHQAMVARGYDGEVRLLTTLQVGRSDLWFLAGVAVLIGGVIAMAWAGSVAG